MDSKESRNDIEMIEENIVKSKKKKYIQNLKLNGSRSGLGFRI